MDPENMLPGQKYATPPDVKSYYLTLNRVMEQGYFMKVYINRSHKVKWQKNGAWNMESYHLKKHRKFLIDIREKRKDEYVLF